MPAIHRLLALTRGKHAVEKSFRSILDTIFTGGKQPALVHLLLGINSDRQGRSEEASRDFEQALSNNSEMVVVANNLARELAATEPTDCNTALAIINAAMNAGPNTLGLRALRGYILAKLGRWQQAFTDLEAALPALADKDPAYRTLAEGCQHLGMVELAALYGRLAGDSSR